MLTDMMARPALGALLLMVVLGCGSSASATDPDGGPTVPTPPPSGDVAPGVVTGIAVDAHGQPIAGARVWIRPAVTTGLLQATTGADGRYRVQGPANIPYYAYAWTTINYRGRSVCLRLASQQESDYDSFVPTNGAVRNFRLQAEGEIGAGSGTYFGGDVRLFLPAIPAGMRLEVRFVPDGPLVDGSAGRTITRDGSRPLLEGLPVGAYMTRAWLVAPDGTRLPLEVNTDGGDAYAEQTLLQWETDGSCVGSTGSGPDRAFLWIRVPGED